MTTKRELKLRIELLEEKVKDFEKPWHIKIPEPVYMNARAQGNTFRGVLTAIIAASSMPDSTIVYVTHDSNSAKDLFKRAQDSIFGYNWGYFESNQNQNMIKFPNGTVLRFISYENINRGSLGSLTGLKNLKIYYDHYV